MTKKLLASFFVDTVYMLHLCPLRLTHTTMDAPFSCTRRLAGVVASNVDRVSHGNSPNAHFCQTRHKFHVLCCRSLTQITSTSARHLDVKLYLCAVAG